VNVRIERFKDPNYALKIAAAYLWGIPWAAVGVLLCLTIVLSPVGLLCFAIAGWPLSYVQAKHLERKRAWTKRDRPLPNDEPKPWELTETESQIDELVPDE
jgi:hypothetical protein